MAPPFPVRPRTPHGHSAASQPHCAGCTHCTPYGIHPPIHTEATPLVPCGDSLCARTLRRPSGAPSLPHTQAKLPLLSFPTGACTSTCTHACATPQLALHRADVCPPPRVLLSRALPTLLPRPRVPRQHVAVVGTRQLSRGTLGCGALGQKAPWGLHSNVLAAALLAACRCGGGLSPLH